ncbi:MULTISPECIES: hypothetical protein [unclassified Serratia (in: enterobacteria)]|uniref:hypothetical protein n=1 Tax=unclassified Serratia (in: enterobacteria) TaxID=2647522 RepID=UPI0005050852|nr:MULTISPECIES: hypothetical protein [unclassified Serratia (in: enterobacteria)]KFK95582.1 hypothetical protein JV45_07435 [Serratia sp. Ag2]KFL00404.1 hypothetical protein IV04_02885 [Serratia sp. Ag1]
MKILLTLLLCLNSLAVQASEWAAWPTVGSATLRWGPFDIYYYRPQPNHPVQPFGERLDSAFRDAFLAIWLSPAAQYPALRQQLTGAS